MNSEFPDWDQPRPQAKLLPRRAERVAYTLRLELDDITPPIWRRVRVGSDVPLDQFHAIVQLAMGWTNSHLHQFTVGPSERDRSVAPLLTPFDLSEGDTGTLENDVRLDEVLGEPGHRLFYEYDFGDGWEHTITLEQVEPWREGERPACLAGARACPAEDVGGVPGHQEMVDALAGVIDDNNRSWVEEKLAWLPPGYDPEAFEVDEVNEALRAHSTVDYAEWHEHLSELVRISGGSMLSPVARVMANVAEDRVTLTDEEAQSAVHRYQLLLDAVGSGIKLTAAGYLPPKAAKELLQRLGI